MPDVTYVLPAAAEAAVAKERARLLKLRKLHLLSSKQVSRLFYPFLAQMLWQARTTEVDGDKIIATECQGCRRVHMMPLSQRWYRCRCSEISRPSFRYRVQLT